MKAPFILLCCAAQAIVHAALAQSPAYPAKPVRLVVPLAPGGGADTLGRYMAKHLTDSLGQPVVVENRSGGGGVVGGEYVARSTPDGYTLIIAGSGQMVVTLTHGKPDLRKDFTPVAPLMEYASLLVVHPSLPVMSVADLITMAKSHPGQLNYGSAGNGSAGHLIMEMLRTAAKIDIVHIPYKGAGPALTELMAGQVSMLFNNPLGSMPMVKAGRVRALATSGSRRMSAMPNIPTVAESGLPGFEAMFFLGVMGPANLPRDIVTRLNTASVRIVQRRDVQEWLAHQGAEPLTGTPEDFAARVQTDMQKLAKLVRDANVKLN